MVGTAVTPGIGSRLRRAALRLLAGAVLAALAWLLGSVVNSGTASAAENSSQHHGGTHSTRSNDSEATGNSGSELRGGNGLLGSLLGGLGNTLSGTLSNVTGTVSSLTSSVTGVTTGLVGDLTSGLGSTLDTVTGIVAPTHGTTSPGATGAGNPKPGGTTRSPSAGTKPTDQHVDTAATPVAPAAVVVAPVTVSVTEPAAPVVVHKSASVVAQQVWAPVRHVLVLPGQSLPDDPSAPQPAPAPAVPVSFTSPGHGSHGPARHVLGACATHLTAPTPAAFSVGSPDSAAMAARHLGLPPTTPD
ncbi:MAG TPA: hypothetical protein VH333_00140 [Pseudonocardiaceae bacterium]|nr:hypothetical protein [Pseudonocardiaceae bacterium]